MHTINHHVIDANTQSISVQQSTQFSETSLNLKWAAIIFKSFDDIYLDKWTEKFTNTQRLEAHMRQWSLGISGLTPNQIKYGIDQCRVKNKWAPEISAFIAYAKSGESEIYQGEAYRRWLTPDEQRSDPAKVKSSLEKIRRCIRF